MKIEPFMLHKSTFSHLKQIVKKLLEDPKSRWRVEIKPWRDKRSIPQNSSFHLACAMVSKELTKRGGERYTPAYVKEMFKATFLGTERVERLNAVTKELVVTEEVRHTSDLDKGELNFLIGQIQMWALTTLELIIEFESDSEFMRVNKEMESDV